MKITACKMVRPSVDQDRNSLIFDSSQTNIAIIYALSLTCGNIAGDQFRVQRNCPPTPLLSQHDFSLRDKCWLRGGGGG